MYRPTSPLTLLASITCLLPSLTHALPEIQVSTTFSTDSYNIFEADVPAFSALNQYWAVRQENLCSPNIRHIPGSACTIAFDCAGISKPFVALNCLGSYLIDQLLPNITEHTTEHFPGVKDVCHNKDCSGGEDPYDVAHEGLPTTGRILVLDQGDTTTEHAHLEWTITCPGPSHAACGLLSGLESAYKSGSIIPYIGPIFSAFGLLTSVFAQATC